MGLSSARYRGQNLRLDLITDLFFPPSIDGLPNRSDGNQASLLEKYPDQNLASTTEQRLEMLR